MTEPLRQVTDVRELLELADLDDVIFYAIHSERHESPRETQAEEVQGLDLSLNLFRDGVRLEVRCAVNVDSPEARYSVDAASRYTLQEDVDVTDNAMADFVGKVGLMAVYPYLREAVHQAASKLRCTPPMLGLLQSGQTQVRPVSPERSLDGPKE